eukprot:TRINITY_DN259_c0_g1_i2.p1 TRINITY_DN259_c0_g1~~TRINITY_DN259_c0_g1_i2.p1  ORF type:complete len:228 (-),score=26.17 TRINITY_DN259_c0_g1_i2:192-875(-)
MNILLMAPALLLLLLKDTSLLRVTLALGVAAALQVVLGLPFLLTYPWSYIARSFELSRVFIHHWSVNLKFVPEDIFLSKPLAIMLLVLHLSLLFLFANYRWCRSSGGIVQTVKSQQTAGPARSRVTAAHVTTVMFVANFIGIVCARTLHYQFYSWYFHMLPYLLWRCSFPIIARLILWAGIEYCWNVYPSTPASSALLLALHVTVLVGLWFGKAESPYVPAPKSKGL